MAQIQRGLPSPMHSFFRPNTQSRPTANSAQNPIQQNSNSFERSAGSPQRSVGTQLQQQVSGGNNVNRGERGPAVNDLQQLLNRSGAQPPLQVDGQFGGRTEAAVRDFQRQNGLTVDGIVGPQTMQALQGQHNLAPTNTSTPQAPAPNAQTSAQAKPSGQTTAPPTVRADTLQQADRARRGQGINNFATEPGRATSPFGATRSEREQQAEQILRANGQWPPEDGRAYVVQIDQDSPPSSASRGDRRDYVRNYTGQTVVFRAENGRLTEQNDRGPFRSASHPGQFTTSAAPDINGDGSSDIAHIRPGVYQYRSRPNGDGRYNPTSNRQFSVARDSNHDGVIGDNERNGQHSATGIQIHAGRPGGPSSIGCQTMPPNDYNQFQDAVRQANTNNNSDFTYILVRRPHEQFGENRF